MIHIENTTIEEQIAYEKDFAKFCLEQAEKWKNKDLGEYGYHMKTYRESTNKYRWLEELKAHREAWCKVSERLNAMHSEGYYRHQMENWFFGVGDAIKVVERYRPKEGDGE